MKLSSTQSLAGILEPIFAIRTETDLGIGDTNGLRQMIDYCSRHHINILQVLPINETSDDNSPYNAISSMAIEPSTIDIRPESNPDLSPAKFKSIAKSSLLKSLRTGPVQYDKVKKLKRALLEVAFDSFYKNVYGTGESRDRDFSAFITEHAEWIHDYALFRVLMERHNGWPLWPTWPNEHQNPRRAASWLLTLHPKERGEIQRRQLYFCYVQWLAYRQWESVKAYGTEKKVFLMGDIPIGVSRYSADVWADRMIFDLEWCGGAPPEKVFKADPFTEKWGQNWGIPLYRWDVLRQRNFDWWRLRVQNISRAFHIFRIDHVLGFYRFYSFPWTPDRNDFFLPLSEEEARAHTGGRLPHFKQHADDTEEHKAINRAQGEELLSMILDAAGETTVVAEDLGVVPDYVWPSLEKLGIPGFSIPSFLRTKDGHYADPSTYRKLSIAAPATHDLMPLALAWQQAWKDIDSGNEEDATKARNEIRAILHYAGLPHLVDQPPREYTTEIHNGYLRAVLSSNAWMVITMITDVFADPGRFNIPGKADPTNWTYRIPYPVSKLDEHPELRSRMETYASLAAQYGRRID